MPQIEPTQNGSKTWVRSKFTARFEPRLTKPENRTLGVAKGSGSAIVQASGSDRFLAGSIHHRCPTIESRII
jgi:hypothetical protein